IDKVDVQTAKRYSDILSQIQASKRPSTNIVRVSQLDSMKLDEEILELLKSQFMRIFMFFRPTFVQNFQPEINLILKSVIFKLSIFNLGTTYGNQLQNLTFRNERAFDATKGSDYISRLTLQQKWLSGLVNIGGEWAWARINRKAANEAWGDLPDDSLKKRVWRILNHLETVYKLLSILNFLAFLFDGKYVTLVNRILCMRLVYAQPSLSRRISFEYMNRQLVWHGFTEFFLFIMPLINIDRIKGFIYRTFIQKPSNMFQQQNRSQQGEDAALAPQLLAPLVLEKCPICFNDPISVPYITDCGHLFCYYCIKTNCMIDPTFTCPRCNSIVSNMKRFTPFAEPSSNTSSPRLAANGNGNN
ncbi:hypothetical protein SAMD00019534_091910, partial [Acytostelium subglobosum LB1]|uniref:hypothetical protein n=1 Tax=Acytostelium subglobosum LB1 TaxID=1410327 RepID=UPI00064503DB